MELSSDTVIYCSTRKNRTLYKLSTSLVTRIQEKTGIKLSVLYGGDEPATISDSEIVLGYCTERKASIGAYNTFAPNEYGVYVEGQNAVLTAWSEDDLNTAADLFIQSALTQEDGRWVITSQSADRDTEDAPAAALGAYRIVYAEGADDSIVNTFIPWLQSHLLTQYGAELTAVSDAEAPIDHEIVVGVTNRSTDAVNSLMENIQPYTDIEQALSELGCAIVPDGSRIFLLGYTANALSRAAGRLNSYLSTPEMGPPILSASGEVNTIPMLVDARLTLEKYKEPLSNALTNAGKEYAITSDGSATGFDAVVVLAVEQASYSVTVTDDAILVRAGHYLALESAFKEILAGKGLDGSSFSGTYTGAVPLTNEENMVLVWNEEFDGETLDLAKWALNAKMVVGDIFNGDGERNIAVTDGDLLLRTWKEEEMPGYVYSTNTSVTTDGTLSFKYGYLEMSAIVPYENGAWPSFWLLGSDLHKTSEYRAEVDILEVFGSVNTGYSMLHKARLEPSFVNFSTDRYSGYDRQFKFDSSEEKTLKTEYHRYGFGWTPTEMYFTLDGEVYFTHDITEAGNFGEGDMSCFHDPMYIIFNNFIYSPSYPGPTMPSENTEFPIEYRIDWVRLYQTTGEGAIHFDVYN